MAGSSEGIARAGIQASRPRRSHLVTDINIALRGSVLYRRVMLEKKRRVFLDAAWRDELARWNEATDRIRVGFGPIVEPESTLGVRKWHIDPIVNFINRNNRAYVCDVFFRGENLGRFDLVVVVRDFDHFTPRVMRRLTRRGTRVLYKVADNPAACRRSYLQDTEFLREVAGIIAANPLQADDVRRHGRPVRLIGAPILSPVHKQSYATGGPVKVLWQGHAAHMAFHESLGPLTRRVAQAAGRPVRMVYHTRLPAGRTMDPRDADYIPWTMENAFAPLADADIAVSIKPPSDPIQQRKPATKVMTYMAAGLPVVCAPSKADRMLIEHGRTGFFAQSEEEWLTCLRMLVEDEGLRERVGRAAREFALAGFSIETVAQAHIAFFDEILTRTDGTLHGAELQERKGDD